MNKTKIEWCDSTLNPVVGCTFGCPYCYARVMNNRFPQISKWNEPQFFPDRLKQLKSKKSKNIFMDYMSDIADWKQEWIDQVAQAIEENPQHNYLFLTKRPSSITYSIGKYWRLIRQENVWLGVSVTKFDESMEQQIRLCELASLKNKYIYLKLNSNLFVSFEPLHGKVDLNEFSSKFMLDFKWFIIGAETGKRRNQFIPKKIWIDEIVEKAKLNEIQVFMKDSLIPIVGEEGMLREFPKELKHDA